MGAGKASWDCLPSAKIYIRTSTPRNPDASISANLVDETSSFSKQNDQDSDLRGDSEEKEPHSPRPFPPPPPPKKKPQKAA